MQFEYSGHISKITEIWKLMQIHAVGAELFHADGRNVTYEECNAHCPEICNKPKNPCGVPKQEQTSTLYMDQYSAPWSVCVETDSIQLTAVTGTDKLPHSQ